jgi:hypothetical protein
MSVLGFAQKTVRTGATGDASLLQNVAEQGLIKTVP